MSDGYAEWASRQARERAAAMCWGYFYDWSHPIWLGLAWMFIGLSTRAFMLAMGKP